MNATPNNIEIAVVDGLEKKEYAITLDPGEVHQIHCHAQNYVSTNTIMMLKLVGLMLIIKLIVLDSEEHEYLKDA